MTDSWDQRWERKQRREKRNTTLVCDKIREKAGIKGIKRHLDKVANKYGEYPTDLVPEIFVKIISGDRKGTIARVQTFTYYTSGGISVNHFGIKVDGRRGIWGVRTSEVQVLKNKKETKFVEIPKEDKVVEPLVDRYNRVVEVGQNVIISYSENVNGWYRKGYLRFVHVVKTTPRQISVVDLKDGEEFTIRPNDQSFVIINDGIADQFALERVSSIFV